MTRARSTPTMGILAGMGPRSTAPFIDAVVDECQRQYGARHDIDFPPMMIFSLPAPFYLDRPIDHDALRSAIVDGVSRLASVGVDIIAVPCNSAQLYFEDLARAITVPMVSMTENAVAALDPGARRIALVATHATVRSGLYQELLHRAGKQVIARPELQADVDAAIAAAKSGDGAGAVQRWRGVMQRLAGLGCDAVLLACTDLALAARARGPLPRHRRRPGARAGARPALAAARDDRIARGRLIDPPPGAESALASRGPRRTWGMATASAATVSHVCEPGAGRRELG